MKSGVQPPMRLRSAQMFPTLSEAEIGRLRRFGDVRNFVAGEVLVTAGQTGHGIKILLSGEVDISHADGTGAHAVIMTHKPGEFLGELAQLSGRAALVSARAATDGEVLVIPPSELRALLVSDAELGERIMRALILRRVNLMELGAGGPIIIGPASNKDVLRITGFLSRNGHPHTQLDAVEDPDARALIDQFHVPQHNLPIVLCPDGELLRNPEEAELAKCIGLMAEIDEAKLYDVVVVGGGPAGLAASVYASSEGLSVLMLDGRSFGGQAGASARIENFLGFPTGISGMALMGRSYAQAQKFGVEMGIPNEVLGLDSDDRADGDHLVALSTGETIKTRAVIIATGARYRRLNVEGIESFEGTSVHYWASPLEGRLCAGENIALVGGGNSAGQAAVFLASTAAHVTVIARRPLEATMSRYLVDRISAQANVKVVTDAQVVQLTGTEGRLDAVHWQGRHSAEAERVEVRHLFLFIGAKPNTEWLSGSGVLLDARGFVVTGKDAGSDRFPMETTRRGIFAIGDVRAGSVKRVASAAGDGSQAVFSVHNYFGERLAFLHGKG